MRKSYIALAAAGGLFLALGASAEAAGRGPGGPSFTPPGFSQGNKTWTTPPGWTNPNGNGATERTLHGWSPTGGATPPGLGTVPPSH
jgi:hypothetical protein